MQISELGMILTAFHLGGWNFYTSVVKTGFVQNTTQNGTSRQTRLSLCLIGTTSWMITSRATWK